ncbi:MAG: amidohydrolase [Paracoccaceae bacterium]
MTKADLIIENARVLTMNPAQPRAEAVAVRGHQILAVGSASEIGALAGQGTRRFDAQGNSVIPGLIESHMHLFLGAFGLRLLHLDGVHGLEALRAAVVPYAHANPAEALLICKATDYSLFGDGVATTRHLLDQVLADRPLICIAGDHHTAWANTIALDRAGLLQGREMPAGSAMVMGADGTATGELHEQAAIDALLSLRSSGGREHLGLLGLEPGADLTPTQRDADLAVMREGLRHCASFGFTSLHNMDGNAYQLALLQELEDRGELLCRTEIPYHFTPDKPLSALDEASWMHQTYRSDRLRSGRIKTFMDGVVDSGTAFLVDDYADRPGWHGEALHKAEAFNALAIEADRRGLQISVHAIGDAAVRRVLDGYEAARKANGPRDSRHRIEHIELLHPADFHRLRDLGVIASMQPPHPPGAMDFPLEPWRSRVGQTRWPHAFPVRALRDAGVPVALSSDWPVSDINPMRGIKAAMMRPRWTPDCPDNRLTLDEALHGYTAGGAYTGFDEDRLGRLMPGMQADIAVIDHDLTTLDPDQIDTARAALTVCAGAITWEA